jgi:aspartate/glutamate racemase
VNKIIREIAGGRIEIDQSERLREVIVKTSKTTPFDGVIIACTELPLALAKAPIVQGFSIVDTMQVFSARLVSLARGS